MGKIRFSLRLLILLVTAFSVWMGTIGVRWQREKDAIAWVKANGGKVHHERHTNRIVAVELPRLAGIKTLAPLVYLRDLGRIEADFNDVSDLTPLKGLRQLRVISLDNNRISDITPLASLTNLTTLSIARNKVEDISSVSGMQKLSLFYAPNNQIADPSPLYGLKNLQMVVLGGNNLHEDEVIKNARPQ